MCVPLAGSTHLFYVPNKGSFSGPGCVGGGLDSLTWSKICAQPYTAIHNHTASSHLHPYTASYSQIHAKRYTCSDILPYTAIYSHIPPYTTVCNHIEPYTSIKSRIHSTGTCSHIQPYTAIYNHIGPYTRKDAN